MIFENVSLLGYEHSNKFLSENNFVISNIKTFSIRGYILDLVNYSGVENIITDVHSLSKELSQFQDIIINGKFFGRGKAKSFSVDAGDWVRTTEYQVSFEVISEIDLSQNLLNSNEFSGLNLSKKKFYLIDTFSDSFSLDFDNNNSILSGSHSIELKLNSSNESDDLLYFTKIIAKELLSTLPSNLSDGNYFYRADYIINSSETYNLITKRCSIKNTFSYKNQANITLPYSVNTTHSIQINTDGVITVVESGDIKAESGRFSKSYSIMFGIQQELAQAASRCLTYFNKYKLDVSSNSSTIDPLVTTKELEKNLVINKFDGTGSYSITYNNDAKRKDLYSLNRSLTITRNEDGVWTAEEQGSVDGNGKNNSDEKYNNASYGWSLVKPGIQSRVFAFYNNYAKNKSGSNLVQVSKNISKSYFDSKISYTYIYSDDPNLSSDLDGGKYEISVSDTNISPLVKDFIIVNNKYALQQDLGLKTQGQQSITVNMLGPGPNDPLCIQKYTPQGAGAFQFDGMLYFNKMLQKAGFQSNRAAVGAKDYYTESISFSTNEIEKTATLEKVYKYS